MQNEASFFAFLTASITWTIDVSIDSALAISMVSGPSRSSFRRWRSSEASSIPTLPFMTMRTPSFLAFLKTTGISLIPSTRSGSVPSAYFRHLESYISISGLCLLETIGKKTDFEASMGLISR